MFLHYILLFSILTVKVRSEDYPPFYALDLDDGYGMQLLASWGKNCPFYRNKDSVVNDGILYFYKDSASVWSVSKSGSYQKPYNKCPEIIKSATLLFTLPDAAALPSREGWYNVTKANIIGAHNETVTLNLWEVDTCKIYTKACHCHKVLMMLKTLKSVKKILRPSTFSRVQMTFFSFQQEPIPIVTIQHVHLQ